MEGAAAPSCGVGRGRLRMRRHASAAAEASSRSMRCFGLSSSIRQARAESCGMQRQSCARRAATRAALIESLRSSPMRRSRSWRCSSISRSTQPRLYVSLAAPYGLRPSTSGDIYMSVPHREWRRGDALSRRDDSPAHASPKSPSLTVRSFRVTNTLDDFKSRCRMPHSCTWRIVRHSVDRNSSIFTSVKGSSLRRHCRRSIRSPPAQNSITICTEQPPFSCR
mmetsp:Transcript_6/g.15  ORF Transcript_6/g.15 Transcript_6/m.15 type:complete len:223 (-) Transcript_6:272-940(-)